jgi:hypothetical protein
MGSHGQVAGRAFGGTVKATASPPTIARTNERLREIKTSRTVNPREGSKEVRGDERNRKLREKLAKGGL